MKNRMGFGREIKNLLAGSYLVWLCFSVYLSTKYGNQIAKLFTDLPENIKSAPSFLLSLIYLTVFVPSIVFASSIILYFLLTLVKNGFEFNPMEKESSFRFTGNKAN